MGKLTGCVDCKLHCKQSPFSSKTVGMNAKQVAYESDGSGDAASQ